MMTDAEHAALTGYVRQLAGLLRLRDWTIDVERTPCDEDCHADIETIEGRRQARMRVSADWSTYPPAEQRHSITHELLHLHRTAADDVIRYDLCGLLGRDVYTALWAGYERQMEYATDGIADAVAPLLPLPSPSPSAG